MDSFLIHLIFSLSLRPRRAHPFWRSPKRMQKGWSRGRTAPLHLTVRRTQYSKGRGNSGRGKVCGGSRACPLHDPRSRRAVMQHKEGSLLKRGTTDWPLPFRNPFKSIPTWVRPGIVKGRVFRPNSALPATTALSPLAIPNSACSQMAEGSGTP